ncbi:MAG: 30S ribosomal protein S12 methylthiotransferase RimO [Desulfurivibrionaceae bacterium]
MIKNKAIHITSLGCPKNLVDSEVILGFLYRSGCYPCDEPEQADILIVNTCGFIRSAVEEGVEEVLSCCRLKEEDPSKTIVVTGCLVQRYGLELLPELPEVDLFIGTEGFSRIAEYLDQAVRERAETDAKMVLLDPVSIMENSWPRHLSTPIHRAYLKIMEGCSNKCTYCLIPSLRGRMRSRGVEDLVVEAGRLVDSGVREITLVGQDITSYAAGRGEGLTFLLRRILDSTGVDWLRLLYLYPDKIGEELLELMAADERLLPYFDIPLQHVSDPILKKMGRTTRDGAYELIDRIRSYLPEAGIRTTFMVGFPGETEHDLEFIARFMRECRLDNVGVFTFSNEEGCAAGKLPHHLSEEVKKSRYDYLMEIQAEISLQKNRARVGQVLPVLVEGVSSETDLLLEARTSFQAPDIDGVVYINEGRCNAGDIIDVAITEAHPYDLVGSLVDKG